MEARHPAARGDFGERDLAVERQFDGPQGDGDGGGRGWWHGRVIACFAVARLIGIAGGGG